MKSLRTIKITTTIAALFTAISLVDGYDITYKDAWVALIIIALIIIQVLEQAIKESLK